MSEIITAAVLGLVAGLAIGYLVAHLRSQRVHNEKARLEEQVRHLSSAQDEVRILREEKSGLMASLAETRKEKAMTIRQNRRGTPKMWVALLAFLAFTAACGAEWYSGAGER